MVCEADGYDRIAEVTCGKDFTVALDVKGRLLAWGAAESGKLGLGDRIDRNVPAAVQGIPEGTPKHIRIVYIYIYCIYIYLYILSIYIYSIICSIYIYVVYI